MPSSNPIRLAGLAAILGATVEIVVAPLISSAYAMTETGAGLAPPWEPALSRAFTPLFTFAPPEAVYQTYGKLHLVVLLGLVFGLLGLRAWRAERAGRFERWGYRLALAGLLLNLPGNVLDYWVTGSSTAGDLGFVLGTVLGLLLLVAGSAMFGVALLQAGARGYLLKGSPKAEILRAVRAVASGEAIFGPAVARRLMHYFSAARPDAPANVFPELTEREREILALIARHETNPEIATRLNLSSKTIRNHVSNIFAKLQVADRAQAIIRAREAGMGRGDGVTGDGVTG